MRKWWRRFKNKHGWDFHKLDIGRFYYQVVPARVPNHIYTHEEELIMDVNGCYAYICKYCGLTIKFPWRHTVLAYHNMQRHIKAKHIDSL